MTTNIQEVLDCPMQENDSGAYTVKGYLKALLIAVWDEGESFSGKRPFGNSGWDSDILDALVDAGLAKNYPSATKLIFKAITAL